MKESLRAQKRATSGKNGDGKKSNNLDRFNQQITATIFELDEAHLKVSLIEEKIAKWKPLPQEDTKDEHK